MVVVVRNISNTGFYGEQFHADTGEFSRTVEGSYDASSRSRRSDAIRDALSKDTTTIVPQSVYERDREEFDRYILTNPNIKVVPDAEAQSYAIRGRQVNENVEARKAAIQEQRRQGFEPSSLTGRENIERSMLAEKARSDYTPSFGSIVDRNEGVRGKLEQAGVFKYEVAGKTFSKREMAEGYAAQLSRESAKKAQQEGAYQGTYKDYISGTDRPHGVARQKAIADDYYTKPFYDFTAEFSEGGRMAVNTFFGIDENAHPVTRVIAGGGRFVANIPEWIGSLAIGTEAIVREPTKAPERAVTGLGIMGESITTGFQEDPWGSAGELGAMILGPKAVGKGAKAVKSTVRGAKEGFKSPGEAELVNIAGGRAKPTVESTFDISTGGGASYTGIMSGARVTPIITEPIFNIKTGGAVTDSIFQSRSRAFATTGMTVIAAASLSQEAAAKGESLNQLRQAAYETAVDVTRGKSDIYGVKPPASPMRIETGLKRGKAVELAQQVTKEMQAAGLEVETRGTRIYATGKKDVIADMSYFNSAKEAMGERFVKDFGSERLTGMNILSMQGKRTPWIGDMGILDKYFYGNPADVPLFNFKGVTGLGSKPARANLRKAYFEKLSSDAEWSDYEMWKEAGRQDVIDRLYPTPKPKPVTEAEIGYDLRKATHKKIVTDAEWFKEEKKLFQVPKDMRKLGMGYYLEAKVRPKRRGTKAILMDRPAEPEYGAYSEIAIPLMLEKELAIEVPQELVTLSKQKPAHVAVTTQKQKTKQTQRQEQRTKNIQRFAFHQKYSQDDVFGLDQIQAPVTLQVSKHVQPQKYKQTAYQIPKMDTPALQRQKQVSKQVSVEKQIQKMMSGTKQIIKFDMPKPKVRKSTTTKGGKKDGFFRTYRASPIMDPLAGWGKKRRYSKKRGKR